MGPCSKQHRIIMYRQNEFYKPTARCYEATEPNNPGKTVMKKGLIRFVPVEEFEAFKLVGCDHSFAIATNCTIPYVRATTQSEINDMGAGVIFWKVSETGIYAASQTFRDEHRPVVASGLAAVLLANSKYFFDNWHIDLQVRDDYKQKVKRLLGVEAFTDKELKQHQTMERNLWLDSMTECKKWIPRDLLDEITRIVEEYCSESIVERDRQILEIFGNDTMQYDMFFEQCRKAASLNRLGDIVAETLKARGAKRGMMKKLISLMQRSKLFDLLNNGCDEDKNYRSMTA